MARDDWDDESDVDIIIVYETPKRFLERLKELYEAWNIKIAIDILAYTPHEFSLMLKTNPFIQNAAKEGKIIYERN